MQTSQHTETETSRDWGPPPKHAPRGRLVAAFAVLGLIVTGAIAAGLLPRLTRQRTLIASTQEDATRAPAVNVSSVELSSPRGELELPGNTMAQAETPVYARADGYVRRRLVDVGDRVTAGQVLAEIETPELDQQIEQAQANLSQAKANLTQIQANLVQARANLKLADVTARRWKNLAAKGVFAQQDADEKQANFEAQQAQVQAAEAAVGVAENTIAASEANIRRLQNLKAFDRVVAPFDGVITSRDVNLDAGMLVNAGNNGPNRELFRVSQIDIIRVFVNVPQAYIDSIHPGQTATLTVDDMPGRSFPATVRRDTHALDTSSRTQLSILRVLNPDGALRPGLYGRVKFVLPHPKRSLVIDSNALVVRTDGPQVAVVGPDHKVHFRKITLGIDYGPRIEVTSGLSQGELVVLNPTDEVRENATVDPHVTVRGQ